MKVNTIKGKNDLWLKTIESKIQLKMRTIEG